jgi:hypothetical protein
MLGDLVVVDLELGRMFIGESFDGAESRFPCVPIGDATREDPFSAGLHFDRSESFNLGNEHDGAAQGHSVSHVCHVRSHPLGILLPGAAKVNPSV